MNWTYKSFSSRMLLSLCGFGLLVGFSSAALAKSKYIFTPEPNGLDYSDHYGKLSAWLSLGDVKLADGMTLPLNFNFHSAQDKVGNSILGWNWWFPFMESTAVKQSEKEVIVRMVGGRRLHLYRTAADPKRYRSMDHQWQGVIDDHGGFRVVNAKEKWKLDYKKGKLKKMAMPSGEELEWSYDVSGNPMAVTNSAGVKLVDISYGSEGFPERFSYVDAEGESQMVKLHVGNASEVGLPILVPALKSVDSPKEKVENFKYQMDGAESYQLSAKHAEASSSAVKEEIFNWLEKDGGIKFVNGDSYMVEPKGARLRLSKVDGKGVNSSYYYNEKTGVSEWVSGDRKSVRRYSLSGGETFGKFLSVVFTERGIEQYRTVNYYGTSGALIRKSVNGGLYQKYFRENGSIYKMIEKDKKTFYDENGEILRREYKDSMDRDVSSMLDDATGKTILSTDSGSRIEYPTNGSILNNINIK